MMYHKSLYIRIVYSKELIKGTIGTMILKLLEQNGRMYGYEMAQRVKELSKGRLVIKDGSLYPALHRMLEAGVVKYDEENVGNRIRKYYYLTEEGKQEVERQLAELMSFFEMVQDILHNPQKI